MTYREDPNRKPPSEEKFGPLVALVKDTFWHTYPALVTGEESQLKGFPDKTRVGGSDTPR